MAISQLQNSSRAFESISDSWGRCLLFFTCLVVIGLLLEYFHEVFDILSVSVKGKRPSLEQVIKMSGALLVTVGVSGELIAQFQASRAESKFRSIAHAIEGQMIGDNKRTDKAVTDARIRLAIEERAAAEAKTTLAKTELRLAEFKKRQEPRHLNIKEFSQSLVGRPTGTAQILYVPEDKEANDFSMDIYWSLALSGWRLGKGPRPISAETVLAELDRNVPKDQDEAVRTLPLIIRAGGGEDVTILSSQAPDGLPKVHDGSSPINVLCDAFLKHRGDCNFRYAGELPPDLIRIVVGPKP